MKHPYLSDDFLVDWSALTPAHIKPDISRALEKAQAAVDRIANQPVDAVTFASTVLALDTATEPLSRAWGYVSHQSSVCDSPEMRKAYNDMLPAVTDFHSSLYLNAELWSRIRAFSETTDAAKLEGVAKRLLDETVLDFRDSGADLPQAKKARVQVIRSELSRLGQKFSENVLDDTNAWEYYVETESDLAGLPKSAIQAAKEDADEKGHTKQWRFTLHMPSYLPVMRFADSDAMRRTFWEARNKVGWSQAHNNSEVLVQMLHLRQELAELLGKAHFADSVTHRRMAKSGAAALGFIDNLQQRIKPAFDAEMAELEAFKALQTGNPQEALEPWETAYWSEKWRQARFDFDEEALRPYFSIDGVVGGLFDLTQTLFGIRIEKRDAVPVWHPEVQVYDIFDAGEGNTQLGTFYADWHPRPTKRGGAWMNYLRTGTDGKPHLGLMAGNLSKPTSDKPALMTHDEVETIFHEFGHLLHHLLSRVPYRSLAGVNVVWDFVELPSQIMENWCWERDALDRFARHHETGETIPSELLDKMLAARNHMQASFTMRQLALAKVDLELHLQAKSVTADALETMVEAWLEGYRAPLKTQPPSILRSFTHLFGDAVGYAAGYYSYKWAEVLDADAFTRFKKEGVCNPETGLAFRQCILEKGNAAPPQQLYRDFMGRDPDPEALLVRSELT